RFRKAVYDDETILVLGDTCERWRDWKIEHEPLVDLVGQDHQIVPFCQTVQRLLPLDVDYPARGVRRTVHDQHARAGIDRPADTIDIERKSISIPGERHGP